MSAHSPNPVVPSSDRPTSFWRRYFKIPHTFVLLVILTLIATALTYLVPAGEFEREKDPASGNTLVVPNSYHSVEANPISLVEVPRAIVKGLIDASDIVFFVFIIGGAFQVITATGTIEAVTGRVARTFSKRGILVIPVFLALFSVGGFTMGMSSEVMVFVPLGIAIARSLGYDALTGTAMVSLGASIGFTSGLMNPFNVGIAQVIAEVPMFSGMWMRALLLLVLLVITSWYVIRYARRVKKAPAKSIVHNLEGESTDRKMDLTQIPGLQVKHILTVLTIGASFALLIWGVSKKEWWMEELSALFLTMGVVSGFCAGFGPSRIANEFVKGASAITFGAFIIGIARSILIVLEQGNVIDTIVFVLSNAVGHLPGSIQVLGMYFFQTIMNVFITSGTGLAATTMPIMVPLSDLLGVTRQTSVFAFQMGDGFTNMILPTSSALMGSLAVSGITYQQWVKFMWPLMILWVTTGAVFVIIAHMISY
ncbi:C4-dicarboxylate ABC transporter [Marinithermofilum abyssi]|uniref:C4-dicarboxylate ABC transporter n=1 Tax=Marinithermofilum abyssi TaxID=1571185 RepID=A0A8J2VGU0_9BACL|nr:AbgT family transporter [Marinithermofilum abyssi]GGE11925.1 C4-dicarboxylate ABC transporter [Marinithermofilum abyssi]